MLVHSNESCDSLRVAWEKNNWCRADIFYLLRHMYAFRKISKEKKNCLNFNFQLFEKYIEKKCWFFNK